MDEKDILAQLDYKPIRHFPVLDGAYNYTAATRLTGFSKRPYWAMTIEHLIFAQTAGSPFRCRLWIYRYGNCLEGQPGLIAGDGVYPISEGADGPLISPGTVMEIPTSLRTVRIRGQLIQVSPTAEALRAHNIKPVFPGQLIWPDLLRLLATEHRAMVLATDAERRRRMLLELPQILQLDEWHHPDIMKKELASDTECFRLMAKVLANSDPTYYRPTEVPNTDWRNWPMGGML